MAQITRTKRNKLDSMTGSNLTVKTEPNNKFERVLKRAPFDLIIKNILERSESAQATFLYRLIQNLPDEVLATAELYSSKEIKRRAKAVIHN